MNQYHTAPVRQPSQPGSSAPVWKSAASENFELQM